LLIRLTPLYVTRTNTHPPPNFPQNPLCSASIIQRSAACTWIFQPSGLLLVTDEERCVQKCPDPLWGPPSLLFGGYRTVSLPAHIHIVVPPMAWVRTASYFAPIRATCHTPYAVFPPRLLFLPLSPIYLRLHNVLGFAERPSFTPMQNKTRGFFWMF
jgi:hypothetical protein